MKREVFRDLMEKVRLNLIFKVSRMGMDRGRLKNILASPAGQEHLGIFSDVL